MYYRYSDTETKAKHYPMMARIYRTMRVTFQPFLTSALNGGELPALRFVCLNSKDRDPGIHSAGS
jgi:hypothetical protein